MIHTPFTARLRQNWMDILFLTYMESNVALESQQGAERRRRHPPWWVGEASMVTSILGLAVLIGYFAGTTSVIEALRVDHFPIYLIRVFWSALLTVVAIWQAVALIFDSEVHRRWSAGMASLILFSITIKLIESPVLPVLTGGMVSIATWEAIYCWFLWRTPLEWSRKNSLN